MLVIYQTGAVVGTTLLVLSPSVGRVPLEDGQLRDDAQVQEALQELVCLAQQPAIVLNMNGDCAQVLWRLTHTGLGYAMPLVEGARTVLPTFRRWAFRSRATWCSSAAQARGGVTA